MKKPSILRRLAAITIDIALLAVVVPTVGMVIGFALSSLFYLVDRGDCPSPCDGPAMAGFSVAFILIFGVWVLYWPLLIYWRRLTIGSLVVGLRLWLDADRARRASGP